MITIQTVMLVALGFLFAALLGFAVVPAVHARAARLTSNRMRRAIPLTELEIRAEKDGLRAEYAIKIHKLESQLDTAKLSAARQFVEINRRDALISSLEGEVARNRSEIETALNARGVLEQALGERLPRLETRLDEAKKLLNQRDREIAQLAADAEKQNRAIEDAAQLNAQLRVENDRLNASLTTRAPRNRRGPADARFDAKSALRSELEALRAKTREQASMVQRLQAVLAGRVGGLSTQSETELATGGTLEEIESLKRDLSEASSALRSASGTPLAADPADAKLQAKIREQTATIDDQKAQIAKLTAQLAAYETDAAGGEAAAKDVKVAGKARVAALQAQSDAQVETIRKLRSEVAAANERLARQGQHFMEEMRRIGAGTVPVSGEARRPVTESRRSLTDRITSGRPEVTTEARRDSASEKSSSGRESGEAGSGNGTVSIKVAEFLKALGDTSEFEGSREGRAAAC